MIRNISKAQSWSVALKNQLGKDARWVTMNGKHVLIKQHADGQATIVFAGGASHLEHLRLKRKQLKKLLEKDDPKKDTNLGAKEGLARKKANVAAQAMRGVKEAEMKHISNSLGINLKYFGSKKNKDIFRTNDKKESLQNSLTEINNYIIDNVKDTKEKKVLVQTIKNHLSLNATDILTNKVSRDLIGEDLESEVLKDPKTGNIKIDAMLKNINMTEKQALAISGSQQRMNKAKEKIKSKLNKITNLEKLNKINFNKINIPNLKDQEIVEKEISKQRERRRAMLNATFYSMMSNVNRDKQRDRYEEGASQTFDVLSGKYNIEKELIKMLGVELSGRIIGSTLKINSTEKELRSFKNSIKRLSKMDSFNVVSEAINKSKESLEMAKEFKRQVGKGILQSGSARFHIAKQLGITADHLSTASGSLGALNAVILALDNKGNKSFVFDSKRGWRDKEANKFMKKYGFNKNEYTFIKNSKRKAFQIEVKENAIHKFSNERLVREETENLKEIQKIKRNKYYKENWIPKGVPKTFLSTFTVDKVDAKLKNGSAKKLANGNIQMSVAGQMLDFVPYKNKQNFPGFDKRVEEGAQMYRAKMKLRFKPQQQRALRMFELQDRIIGNMEAGLGKTLTMYAALANKKAKGQINYGILSVPSRLVGEALKDSDQFFGNNLKVATVTSGKDIGSVLKDAKAGKYDAVVLGHDLIKAYPEIVKKYQPDFMAVDEAHEVFGQADPTKPTKKFTTLKELSLNSKYVMNLTGTPMKNDLTELASMVHVTRPDLVPDPNSFAKQYGKLNRGTHAFNDIVMQNFRRDLNEVMVNEINPLPVKFFETKYKLEMTEQQKLRYKKIEREYGKNKNKDGASQLREKEHYKNLSDGNWKNNVKFQQMDKNFSKHPDKTHIFHINKTDSIPTILAFLKDHGITKDEVVQYTSRTGGNSRARERLKNKAMNDPKVKVFITDALGGTGISMQKFDITHHLDTANTAALELQRNARNHRTGRENWGNETYSYHYKTISPIEQTKTVMVNSRKRILDAIGDPNIDEKFSSRVKTKIFEAKNIQNQIKLIRNKIKDIKAANEK